MTPRHDVTCRSCGALLGRLNGRRDKVTLMPGVAMFVMVARIDLFCPVTTCGTSRNIRLNEFVVVREPSCPDAVSSSQSIEATDGSPALRSS